MNLRGYQQEGVKQVYEAWRAGHQNVMAVYPCGAGKTILLGHIIHQHQGASCTIAHRQELVSQISLAFAQYGVMHSIIGPSNVVKGIVGLHMEEFGRSFYDPRALCAVAGVDTLISWMKEDAKQRDLLSRWAQQVTLWVTDETHHISGVSNPADFSTGNKWAKAVSLFPNARGLGVTATPERADGKGLGRGRDGVFDTMIVGPNMRDLINMKFLTDYRVFCPPSNLDLDSVGTSADGDYVRKQLAVKTKESTVLGDVVAHYLKIARGKLGVTFVPDTETAAEVAARFNAAGVPAEVVTAKTPDRLRREILKRFAKRELLQLVSVDIFGEGFNLPAIEVVSMARATQSYALHCLDPETEVLTPGGWKKCDEVGDQVVAFDMADGSARVADITGRVKRPLGAGEVMYQMSSPHLDFLVSEGHDLVTKSRSNAASWGKETVAAASARKSMFKVPVAALGRYAGAGLSDGELHFLGWFLSDGCLNKITNSVCITQSVRKEKHIASIRSAIEACGFKYGEGIVKRKDANHADLVRFTISKGTPRGRDKHLTGWARLAQWIDKSIPDCYDALTREELLTLLHTLNLGDGINNHGSLDYNKESLAIACGINHRMADRLQALCVTRGLRCNKSVVQYDVRAKWSYLHIKDVMTSTIAGVGSKDGRIGEKHYKRSHIGVSAERPEFIWCVTNTMGTLITRRNGKVLIMGNCQQFGRALRLLSTDPNKVAIIIDHVGNVLRHGLPDRPRVWTLDRREKRGSGKPDDTIPLRNCTSGVDENGNEMVGCFQPYERTHPRCPYCGCKPVPAGRTVPEMVDGDLCELDPETLAAMRGEVAKVDRHPDEVRRAMERAGHAGVVANSAAKQHEARQQAQGLLREAMSWWGAWRFAEGMGQQEAHRLFYFTFGIDVLSAQALGRPEAEALCARVNDSILKGARG